ncbi:hybrid sensor histidine kinase/response regulator [Oscillatoria acuminata]|uniref:histidine kinase n=1 Tax=Oscillatoria acuminata PCC 6304 TaxID=56110 RepID=K9TLT4_9CYAN|nr:response regulator [Oscillatoria acuminata]AFY82969.1 histidine kinase,Response regulator receiver domain protein,histidine kinase [Oscillatoria acuminata PCC 6304]
MNKNNPSPEPADILIVDDTAANLRLLSIILTRNGYRVRKALTPHLALNAVEASLPHLILLDINMPEMNGYQVCEKLKSNPITREIPIIFISALDDIFDKIKAFEVGGNDYITKPFQEAEVLVRVDHQLKLRSLQMELLAKNRVLEQTLTELKQVHNQLIQNEKMVSLGQLVAGVCHEINNPVNFISGNLTYVKTYVKQLLGLIQKYRQALGSIPPEIEQFEEEIELEFLVEDFPKLVISMEGGSERIRTIVESLRNFSRLDEAELKSVDLHEGLESTLMMLGHRLERSGDRPGITVIKNYTQLPLVRCYAAQLNQVFMNLLTNAIDALESGSRPPRSLPNRQDQDAIGPEPPSPTIWINTAQPTENTVTISIADNGPGMTPELQQQAFDPFFTTKQVGYGTGLGLSISYQIVVEGHGGTLDCQSFPGTGTTFTLGLPLQCPKNPPK